MLTSEQNREKRIEENLTYHHGGESLFGDIVGVVRKLPAEVTEFVITRCAFVSVTEEDVGCVLHARIFRGVDWVIFFGPGLSAQHAQSVIVREIAYAWLRHDNYGMLPPDPQSAAHALICDWGFEDVSRIQPAS